MTIYDVDNNLCDGDENALDIIRGIVAPGRSISGFGELLNLNGEQATYFHRFIHGQSGGGRAEAPPITAAAGAIVWLLRAEAVRLRASGFLL